MSDNNLRSILSDILKGNDAPPLRGGLMFQKASDGVNLTGRVFSWLGEPLQAALFDDLPAKTAVYQD